MALMVSQSRVDRALPLPNVARALGKPVDGIGARFARPRDRVPYRTGANPDSPNVGASCRICELVRQHTRSICCRGGADYEPGGWPLTAFSPRLTFECPGSGTAGAGRLYLMFSPRAARTSRGNEGFEDARIRRPRDVFPVRSRLSARWAALAEWCALPA
jgi:hypothetical protein